MELFAFALAALTLVVLPRTISYDPRSWLIWGREIEHLGLNTRHAATAVKPFPIFIDLVLAYAGSAAPALWLVVARAGSLLALALAFRVGHRLGGVVAGIAAAVALAMSSQFLGYLSVSGMSEPMATAAVLAAVDSHLRSHRGAALGFLVVAGLLRPEVWALLVTYCAWLAYSAGAVRRGLLALVAVVVPAAWFVIDWCGSRQLLRSAVAATHGQAAPVSSSQPGLATLGETWKLASGQVVALFLLGAVMAVLEWRRHSRPGPLLWLSVGALGWLGMDMLLAQARFDTGSARYLMPAVGIACVVAGCVVAGLVGWLRGRLAGGGVAGLVVAGVIAALVAVGIPRILDVAGQTKGAIQDGTRAQQQQTQLQTAIAAAGGRHEILGCRPISTHPLEVPLVAWQLDVPLEGVWVMHPGTGGTVIETGSRQHQLTRSAGHGRAGDWIVRSGCAR